MFKPVECNLCEPANWQGLFTPLLFTNSPSVITRHNFQNKPTSHHSNASDKLGSFPAKAIIILHPICKWQIRKTKYVSEPTATRNEARNSLLITQSLFLTGLAVHSSYNHYIQRRHVNHSRGFWFSAVALQLDASSRVAKTAHKKYSQRSVSSVPPLVAIPVTCTLRA